MCGMSAAPSQSLRAARGSFCVPAALRIGPGGAGAWAAAPARFTTSPTGFVGAGAGTLFQAGTQPRHHRGKRALVYCDDSHIFRLSADVAYSLEFSGVSMHICA